MAYSIKQLDGSIAPGTPIEGRWYCCFETVGFDGEEKYERSGSLGQFVDGSFIDEDGEDVSMVSDNWPDYLVLQS